MQFVTQLGTRTDKHTRLLILRTKLSRHATISNTLALIFLKSLSMHTATQLFSTIFLHLLVRRFELRTHQRTPGGHGGGAVDLLQLFYVDRPLSPLKQIELSSGSFRQVCALLFQRTLNEERQRALATVTLKTLVNFMANLEFRFRKSSTVC